MLRNLRWLAICASMVVILMGLSHDSAIYADNAHNPQAADFRTFDGSDNNSSHPTWGQTNTQLSRSASAAYEDGFSEPRGGGINAAATLPSPRAISNALSAQSSLVFNSLGASDYLWQWGQFLDHDIDLTREAEPHELFAISVPTGDVFFDPLSTGTQIIPLNRSIFDTSTGTSNARQQINEITAFIDASQVYGSDQERASWKRSFVGGRLKISAGNLLPFESSTEFGAGDVRANEQSGLTAMHTLFMREHNRLADLIAADNPNYTDEQIFQRARALVGAQMQIITYGEYHDLLLGPNALPAYGGYDDDVDPSISNEFSTAAYRFGHTMLPGTLLRFDANGNEIANGHLPLRNAFFNIQHILDDGIEPILRGLAVQEAQQIDTLLIDDVRNFLFGPPGSGGFDLAALNIQRGREHGLPSYNQTRLALGLPAANTFADITSDSALQSAFASVYSDVDEVDLWIGGLAEDHVNNGLLGETFHTILVDQFARLRDGDSFWHENLHWVLYGLQTDPILHSNGTLLSQVKLSDIIRWNTDITNIQNDVFMAAPMPPSKDVIYMSSHLSGFVGGLTAADEDILLYDEDDQMASAYPWTQHFNGSNVSVTGDVNAILVLEDSSILMSFEGAITLPNFGTVQPQDIVRFVPSITGDGTAGHFEWYLDGSDIDLTTSNENINAIAMTPDDRLLISTTGAGAVPDESAGTTISFTQHDLLAFTPIQLGQATSGRWEMYFDGSDVGLTSSEENVDGVWVDPATGDIFLSASWNFAVEGLSGDGLDIFVCVPGVLGSVTSCSAFYMFFDASQRGLTSGHHINGFSLLAQEGSEIPLLYLTTANDPTVGQVSFAAEDIIGKDTRTGRWRIYFDGSDVGISANLDAFQILDDSIVMSFNTGATLPSVGTVEETDLVRFVPTRTGDITAGQFEWYFDGSDVELSGTSEDIDAFALTLDGRLLISTAGHGWLTDISDFEDTDLIAFTPTTLGEETAGTWEMYFDGSDVNLDHTIDAENVGGAWIDPILTGPSGLPTIYLTTWGNFHLLGDLTGEARDIFTCTPYALQPDTNCSFDLFFDGSVEGFPSGHAIDAMSVGPDFCVNCNDRPQRPEIVYISSHSAGVVGGVDAGDEDVVLYRESLGSWEQFFDASDLGVLGNVNALLLEPDNSLLVSFASNIELPDLGTVFPQDIVRFVPATTGLTTRGHFEWYFNGSDVELTTSVEDINALARAPDGRLLISTSGDGGSVTGVSSFASQDIIAFTPILLGANTSGTWEMYFDGSDVRLDAGNHNEDIGGLWVDSEIDPDTGLPERILLSTEGPFSVLNLGGNNSDIFSCKPYALGSTTNCAYQSYDNGSSGHVAQNVDGLSLLFNDTGEERLYLTTSANDTIGEVSFEDEDILRYNRVTGGWSLYFDGSDVGLTDDVNAFLVLDDSILVSLEVSNVLAGVGSYDPQDVLRFVPTSTGESTAGTFEWYFDGSDVQLEPHNTGENLDALALAADGRVLVSTTGNASVTGVSSADEDLLAFTPTRLGDWTQGTWELYFDGSDMDLHNSATENIAGAWVDGNYVGELYLTTASSFAGTGLSGDGKDLFVCTLGALGDVTACAFTMFIDGSTEGFPDVDGFSLEQDSQCYTLSTSANQDARGFVSVSPAPNCGVGKYREGTIVTLDANPNLPDYIFSEWTGDAIGTTELINVTMNGNKSVTAHFVPDGECYALTLASNPSDAGEVIASPAPNCDDDPTLYSENTPVTLTANPASGYSFDEWTGDASGSTSPTTVTMDGAKSVTANFSDQCYALTTTANPSAGGTIDANPTPNCPTDNSLYSDGTTVTLTANPNAGYGLGNWSGDASGSTSPTTVTMDSAKSVTGNFVRISPDLLTPSDGASDISVSEQNFSWTSVSGANTYRILVSDDSSFSGFTDDGANSSCDNTCETDTTGATSYSGFTLDADTTYYWRVRGDNPGSTWSDVYSFTTADTDPPTIVIEHVATSNGRDSSFTISWLTNIVTSDNVVRYGTDANNLNHTAYDERGQNHQDDTHHVTINGLTANTTYYFEVSSGGVTDNDHDDGTRYSMTTGATLGVPAVDTIFGEVFLADGTTPAEGTIVYITLEDNNGSGSSGQAAPLSAVVDSDGFWFTNLRNARTADLSDYFTYSASGDSVDLEARGAQDGCGSATVDTADDSPAVSIVLADCGTEWPVPIQPGWNSYSPALNVPYTAEELCDEVNSQGGDLEEVVQWENGGWSGHPCGVSFNNFTLMVGSGYFMRANQASTWTIQGPQVTTPMPFALQTGWNSISIPYTDGYTAESLCQEIISQGVTAVEIDRWHNGGWDGHRCGLPFNNFTIERGFGYFVLATSSGTVTPPVLTSPAQQPERSLSVAPEVTGPFMPVRDLRLANLRDGSVTLSWTTEEATTGYVRLAPPPQSPPMGGMSSNGVFYDSRGADISSTTHLVVLSNLIPGTSYSFEVISGGEVAETPISTFTTAATLDSVPESHTIYGKVLQSDGQSPAAGALVYLTLEDRDGVDSEGQAMLMAALVDDEGYWHANLGNARSSDLSGHFSYAASDVVVIRAQGTGDERASQTLELVNGPQAPDLTLQTTPSAVTLSTLSSQQPPSSTAFLMMAALMLLAGVLVRRRGE